jgi:hypothetical protein
MKFPDVTVSALNARYAEAEIAKQREFDGTTTPYQAAKFVADSLASLICEDVINGDEQYPARIERYVHALRLADAALAPDVSVALAGHTAAALDTIAGAS